MNGSGRTVPRQPRSSAEAQKSSSSNEGMSSSNPPASCQTRRRISVDAWGTPPVETASTNVGIDGAQTKLDSPNARIAVVTKSSDGSASSSAAAASKYPGSSVSSPSS